MEAADIKLEEERIYLINSLAYLLSFESESSIKSLITCSRIKQVDKDIDDYHLYNMYVEELKKNELKEGEFEDE